MLGTLVACGARTDDTGSDPGTPPDPPGPAWRVPAFESAAGIEATGLGRGVAVADFDGDGWLDVLSATSEPASVSSSTVTVHRGLGGGDFAESTAAWGLVSSIETWGLLAVDLEGDGDVDLFRTGSAWNGPAGNLLMRNQGGTFELTPAPLSTCGHGASMGAAAADIDGDHDPDIVVANGSDNALGGCVDILLNEDGELETHEAAGEGTREGFGALVSDLDGDLFPEIVVVSGAGALIYPHLGD